MDIAITLTTIVIASLLGWSYGLRLRRRGLDVETAMNGARGWIAFGLLIATSAALLILSKRTDILSPDASSFLNHAAWEITKGFLAFIGGLSVPLSFNHSVVTRASYVLLALIGLAMVNQAESFVFSPIYPSISQDRRTSDGYVLQTQDMSCTAASLANLLSFYERRTTEYACAKAMRTTRFGSTTGDLVRGMRQFGFQAVEVSATPEHLRSNGRPAILSVWNHNLRHSVVWIGQHEDGTQIIIDPLTGRREVPGSELWPSLSSSRAIALSRPPTTSRREPAL